MFKGPNTQYSMIAFCWPRAQGKSPQLDISSNMLVDTVESWDWILLETWALNVECWVFELISCPHLCISLLLFSLNIQHSTLNFQSSNNVQSPNTQYSKDMQERPGWYQSTLKIEYYLKLEPVECWVLSVSINLLPLDENIIWSRQLADRPSVAIPFDFWKWKVLPPDLHLPCSHRF